MNQSHITTQFETFADSGLKVSILQANEKSSVPIDPPPNYVDVAKKERARIEELIQSKGARNGAFPRFNVAVRGQKVSTFCNFQKISLLFRLFRW